MVARVGQNKTGTSALEFFEINLRPRTCVTGPLMVSSDDWRGCGVAAAFAVIGRLRRARVSRPGLGPRRVPRWLKGTNTSASAHTATAERDEGMCVWE